LCCCLYFVSDSWVALDVIDEPDALKKSDAVVKLQSTFDDDSMASSNNVGGGIQLLLGPMDGGSVSDLAIIDALQQQSRETSSSLVTYHEKVNLIQCNDFLNCIIICCR
jgi:hypothetical protein